MFLEINGSSEFRLRLVSQHFEDNIRRFEIRRSRFRVCYEYRWNRRLRRLK